MFGNSSNTNTSSFSSGLFGQSNQNQNQNQGSLFGSSSGLGSKPMFGSTGNNNGSSGGLFGNALQNNNSNTGFGASQNTGGGLFGNGMNKDKENQGMGGGSMFGSSGGGSGLFGGNKDNSGGSMFGNGGGMMGGGMGLLGGNSMPGTVGYQYDVSRLKKTNDGVYIQSVTAISTYAGKSLDELRTEDYVAMKNKQIPDQKLMELQTQWKKNQEGGGIGQASSGLGGGMFGNSNGNQNQGGGLFGGNSNNNTGGGLFGGATQNNNTGGGLFGASGNNNNTSGGLFGGQQNNNGGGLGMNNNQSKPLFGGSGQTQTGGGLFGQSGGNNNGQSTGGLFGGSTGGQSSGGLFGNSGGNTTGQSTGGLFGGNNSALGGNSGGLGASLSGGSNGGGLFGNNNNNSGATGGLLGQNQGGATSGGLFGGAGNQTAGTGSGLFGSSGAANGQQQTQTAGSGGLFGNSSGQGLAGSTGATGGASSGGLFGNSGAKPAGGGLFGSSTGSTTTTTQASTGGLFGQTQSGATNTTAPGTGLFSGSSAAAAGQSKGGLFSGSTGGSTGASTGGLFSGSTGASTGASTGLSGGLFSGGQAGAATATAQNGQNMQGQGLDQSVNSMTDVVAQIFGAFGQSLSAHEKARELYGDTESESLFSTVMKTKFPSYNPYGNDSKSKKHYEFSTQKASAEKKAQWGSKGKSSLSFMNSTEKEDEVGMNYIFKPQITDMKRIKVTPYKESPEKKSADLTRVYDSVNVSVVFQKENSQDKIYTFDVSLTNTCSEIKNYILKQVLNSEGLNFFQYKLLYKNKILKGQSIFKDIGLRDKDKLYLIPDLESYGSSQVSTISSETSRKSLAPENLIPLLTNNNQTVPSMLKLSRMSEDELSKVENFTIYNENARITFPGKTDLRGMNLNELVVLGHRAVEVYPENGNIEPPQVGTGLNKAATIEFYRWPLPKKYQSNAAEYIAKLKKQSKAQNVQYKGYDADREMLVVSVANFSSKNHM